MNRPLAWGFVGFLGFALCGAAAHASQMTVDLAKPGAPLKKGGLGTLFGITTIAGGTPANHVDGTILHITASQGLASQNGSNPYSTDSIAPLIRGKGIGLMCRLNDLLPGFPYTWLGLAMWDSDVKAAIQDITANYPDVVYGVEVLNEPDQQLNNTAFNTDPLVQGSTYNDRINWLWTHTVQEIRAINPALKLMGPNYLSYLPNSGVAADQAKMQAFLQNAIATGTSLDIIGWHSLLTNEPADIGKSLTAYRQLESQLSVPHAPLPVSIDEYGVNDGTFEGVPGHVVQYWAEMERDGIDFGGEGVYTNYSQLGNTLRYPWQTGQKTMKPNGGWYMLRWYHDMQGVSVPVSPASTRYDQAYDGVASWDASHKMVTLIFGGSDDDADITFNGLGALGLGGKVRVRLESTVWTVDPYQSDTTVERGGDPETGTYSIFDEQMPVSGGSLTIPVHKISKANGYRIVITAAAPADTYPTKYEAEAATLKDASVVSSEPLASGQEYVGPLSKSDSLITFKVSAKKRGIYRMNLRYANKGDDPATQTVMVNGKQQGEVSYVPTEGGPQKEWAFTYKRVALEAGTNTITLKRLDGAAALDYIDVRMDTHRYQAAYAFLNGATARPFFEQYITNDFVGAINNVGSYVEYSIDAPMDGTYNLNIAYANNIAGTDSVNDLSVNGASQGSAILPPTNGWLGDPHDPREFEQVVTVPVTLAAGRNVVRLQKVAGYAEEDYVTLTLQ